MANNHLEELIEEWYEYKGYYVKRNIMVGKREKGGYECELDIIAFNPTTNHLVHLEPSLDSDNWSTREHRYQKKFDAGKKYIKDQFIGFTLPNEIDQFAIFAFATNINHPTLAGGKVISAGDILHEIFLELRTKRLMQHAIPEHLSILRSFQYVCEFRKQVADALTENIEPVKENTASE
jgi:hypothetical protein